VRGVKGGGRCIVSARVCNLCRVVSIWSSLICGIWGSAELN
jgi:hypothetical protein